MAGLANAAGYARGRRPVSSEILTQRAARGIDELVEAERRDAVGHPPPARIGVQFHPGERRLEKMHVRVGALRQRAGAILAESALCVRDVSFERGSQRHGMSAPWCCRAEGAMAARESKQREGLIVEIELRVEHFAIEIDDRRNGAVGTDKIPGEEIERVARCVARRPVPVKPASWNPPLMRSAPTSHHNGSATSNSQRRSAAASPARSLMPRNPLALAASLFVRLNRSFRGLVNAKLHADKCDPMPIGRSPA